MNDFIKFYFKQLILCLLVTLTANSSAQTIVSGIVTGTWEKANSPYIVNGNINEEGTLGYQVQENPNISAYIGN